MHVDIVPYLAVGGFLVFVVRGAIGSKDYRGATMRWWRILGWLFSLSTLAAFLIAVGALGKWWPLSIGAGVAYLALKPLKGLATRRYIRSFDLAATQHVAHNVSSRPLSAATRAAMAAVKRSVPFDE